MISSNKKIKILSIFAIIISVFCYQYFTKAHGVVVVKNLPDSPADYLGANVFETNIQRDLKQNFPTSTQIQKQIQKPKNIGTTTEVILYRVTRIVDGDTIEVLQNQENGNQNTNQKTKLRLIGVDTPETVDPRKKVECFGKEASNFLKNLILNKNVRLVYDKSQGDKDKYGRLLRYVYLDDVFVNKKIIEGGYGQEYTYKIPYIFQKEFKSAQAKARVSKEGLWADGVCSAFN